MPSVLSLGSITLDINVPHFPIPKDARELIGAETVGKEYELALGSSAVNFVRFCKTLGLNAYFIGKVGEDDFANILEGLLKNAGIHPLLKKSGNVQTNVNFNVVGLEDEVLMLNAGSANQSMSPDDVLDTLKQNIKNTDFLYLGGCFKLRNLIQVLPSFVDLAMHHGKKVVLDHGRVVNTATQKEKDIVKKLVSLVDVYLPSKDEFLELWGFSSIQEGLESLNALSNTIIVKDAQNGAYFNQGGKIVNISAFPVKVINNIGAGDAFNAGFIKAMSKRKSIEESAKFANAIAALKISQDHFPSKKEISGLVSKKNYGIL